MDIGKKIAYYRDGKCWSNNDLSRESGVAYSVIYDVLRGKHMPSLKTLQKLCAALDIQEKCLFCEEVHKPEAEEIWGKLSARQKASTLQLVDSLFEENAGC